MTVHGMMEDQSHCELCYESSTIFRIPQMPSVKVVKEESGQIVKEYIEDSRQELKKEKNRLANEEYKS